MLAHLQGGNRGGCMKGVRCADTNCVNLLNFEEFFVVGKNMRDVIIFACLFGRFLVDVCHGQNIDLIHFLIVRQVCATSYTTTANDAYTDLFHGALTP